MGRWGSLHEGRVDRAEKRFEPVQRLLAEVRQDVISMAKQLVSRTPVVEPDLLLVPAKAAHDRVFALKILRRDVLAERPIVERDVVFFRE